MKRVNFNLTTKFYIKWNNIVLLVWSHKILIQYTQSFYDFLVYLQENICIDDIYIVSKNFSINNKLLDFRYELRVIITLNQWIWQESLWFDNVIKNPSLSSFIEQTNIEYINNIYHNIPNYFYESFISISSFEEYLLAHIIASDDIVMKHIYYYLDPANANRLDWIKNSKQYNKSEDKNIYLKNYAELVNWFKINKIDLSYYEYKNYLNTIFKRKTVRVFSSELLPIYFWKNIPKHIINHNRLQGKILNQDIYPLW